MDAEHFTFNLVSTTYGSLLLPRETLLFHLSFYSGSLMAKFPGDQETPRRTSDTQFQLGHLFLSAWRDDWEMGGTHLSRRSGIKTDAGKPNKFQTTEVAGLVIVAVLFGLISSFPGARGGRGTFAMIPSPLPEGSHACTYGMMGGGKGWKSQRLCSCYRCSYGIRYEEERRQRF